MSARVTWAKGGEAVVQSVATDAIVLRSTVPSPPGSRIEGTVIAANGDKTGSMPLRVKVHACRREADAVFVLQGRPVDLTRGQRERLEGLVRGDGG